MSQLCHSTNLLSSASTNTHFCLCWLLQLLFNNFYHECFWQEQGSLFGFGCCLFWCFLFLIFFFPWLSKHKFVLFLLTPRKKTKYKLVQILTLFKKKQQGSRAQGAVGERYRRKNWHSCQTHVHSNASKVYTCQYCFYHRPYTAEHRLEPPPNYTYYFLHRSNNF